MSVAKGRCKKIKQKIITSLKKNFPGGILTIIDQGVFSLTNFLTGIIVGRFTTKEEFGLFLLGYTTIYLALDIQGAFITTPYTIYFPQYNPKQRQTYTGSTLIHQILFSAILTVFLLLVIFIIPQNSLPANLSSVIPSLTIVLWFLLLRGYIRRISYAGLKIKSALWLDIGVGALQLSGIIFLILFKSLTISRAFLVIGFSCCATSAIWLFFKRTTILINFHDVVESLKKNLITGKWILASGILWSISSYLYPWLLVSFHGAESTGVLAACYGTVAICNPIYTALQNYISPRIAHSYAEGGKHDLYKYTYKAILFSGLIMLGFTLILSLTGNFLIVKFYGSKYEGNSMVITMLAFELLLISIGFSISRTLFVIEKAKIDFKINVISAIFLFSFGIWLVKDFGLFGVALGLMVGSLIPLVLRLVYFNHIRRTL